MSSLLRSNKFIRCFAGFGRSFTVNAKDSCTISQRNSYILNTSSYGFSTSISSFKPNEANLDKSLQKIDQDVRRSGRISKRDIEEILEEIRHAQSANSSQSLLVIRCCGNLVPEELPEVRTRLVKEIWNTFDRLNIQLDVSHYNALLRVYLENEHKFSPTEFLAEMESKGIEPNRVTYQRLISQYCQEGDIEGATKILEFMREKQLPVNENVFNALVTGHSQVGDMESARDILNVMSQAGLEPSADTYTALMCGYAKKGDIESIQSLLKDCESKEIYLLDKDFMDIIYALTINGHKDKIGPILDCIKKSYGYNHDAINIILRLVNKGHEDVGLIIMKTMVRSEKSSESSNNSIGGFFIRQLIKANRPFDYIMKVVKLLEEEGLNTKAFSLAAELAFQHGSMETILGILNEMKTTNQPIRHHYLWPLICRAGKLKNDEKVIDILKLYLQFDMIPNGETLRVFVYDNLQEKNPHLAMNLIRSAGLSEALSASTLVVNLLSHSKMKEAADIAMQYRAYHSPYLLRRQLNTCLARTGDVDSYVNILHVVNGNLERRENFASSQTTDEQDEENDAKEEEKQSYGKVDSTGLVLIDLLFLSSKQWKSLLEPVLEALIKKGLGINNHSAKVIQEKLGDNMTPKLSELLSTMSSGELVPLPLNQVNNSKITVNDQAHMESLISTLERKGEQPHGLKRQLLTMYCRNREIDKLEALVSKLKSENFTFSPGAKAQIFETYVHFEKLDKAMELYNEIIANNSDFAIDDFKILRLAHLLLKNNQFDEAVKILDSQPSGRKLEDRSFAYNSICWRLLNYIAENKDTEQLKTIFDKLVSNSFIEISNIILGPLIKIHILRDDIDAAMKEFEWCCEQHNSTPLKTELACMLIRKEDAHNLQKLTDLSTKIHGEVNSLYDLVFAFVECGRIRQARKILETPGLRSRPHRISTACERYLQEGMVMPLEGLMEATRDLSYIDRSDIYYNLLSYYCNNNQTDKAIGLWTKMQEEDVVPTKEFLTKLGTYLECKNVPVPFVIPRSMENVISNNVKMSNEDSPIRLFHKLLRLGDVDKAYAIKKQLHKNRPLSINENSLLLEALLKHDRYNESLEILFELLNKGLYPIPRVFRFCLNKFAIKGDVDTLNKIGNALNKEFKKITSFDNRLCHSYISAGKSEEYLNILDKTIDNAKDGDLNDLENSFPRGGASGILEKNPELLNMFEKIATKYANRGIVAPMNILWIYHFLNNNDELANDIWSKYLTNTPRVLFEHITQVARTTENETLIDKLENVLTQSKVSENALGKVFSCKIDILTSKENVEEALSYLRTCLNHVCLENLNRTSLICLRDAALTKNIDFPYTIPKKAKKLSSTSSSDDEDRKVEQH